MTTVPRRYTSAARTPIVPSGGVMMIDVTYVGGTTANGPGSNSTTTFPGAVPRERDAVQRQQGVRSPSPQPDADPVAVRRGERRASAGETSGRSSLADSRHYTPVVLAPRDA